MQAFLQKYKAGTDFQGIFIHNDDMGIGAIEALKAAGLKPGDLFIVSVDGTRGGFQAMVDGWFLTTRPNCCRLVSTRADGCMKSSHNCAD
jgi:ABC-type sugar transport system substrate-binding protein